MNDTTSKPSMWQRSTTRRFLCWLVTWRGIRMALLCLGALVTLFVLAVAVERWRGQTAFAAAKAEVESQGDSLSETLSDRKEPAEAENFAMTPLLAPMSKYVYDPDGKGGKWQDPKGIERLDKLGFKVRVPQLGCWRLGLRADMVFWSRYMNTNHPASDSQATNAAYILSSLAMWEPELAELRQASLRPYAQFRCSIEERLSLYRDDSTQYLYHAQKLRDIGVLYALHGVASLNRGDTRQAQDDVRMCFYLCNTLKSEPVALVLMIRQTLLDLGIQVIWEGMQSHQWTEADLAQFQQQLKTFDFLQDYEMVMRGERNTIMEFMDLLLQPERNPTWILRNPEFSPLISLRSVISGWLYQNKATLCRYFQELALPVVDARHHRVDPEHARELEQAWQKAHGKLNLYSIAAGMIQGSLYRVSRRAAHAQTYADLALVACALEQKRLQDKQYPARLDMLTTNATIQLPMDVITGQPLRYGTNAQGVLTLYSLGWNNVDDKGVSMTYNQKSRRPIQNMDIGDWTWALPSQ